VAIVVLATNPEERGRGLGLQSAAQAIGLGAGPALGGLILDTLGWHWAFWINVPVGIAGAIIGWFVIPQTRKRGKRGRFDWRGALLIAPALTAVVAALNEGYAWGATSPALIGCVVAAIVFLTLFARAERRAETPLIDFQLLRQGAFLIGNVANFLSYAALFGLFFLVPFVLVRAYQDTALAAGLRLSIVPVMLGLLAPIGGALYDRFGARAVTTSGMAVCIAGLAVLHVFLDGSAANLPMVMLALAIFGIGQGLFISPNSSSIMATAREELTGEAGSLLNMARYLGMSAGIASASALLAMRLGAATGLQGSTINVSAQTLVAASRDVILLLCCFVALAGVLSLMRTVPRKTRGADDGEPAGAPR
jgi:MFS family permease